MKNKTSEILTKLSEDYFKALNLTPRQKKQIFSKIKKEILINKKELLHLLVKEIKLTEKDSEKEILRVYKTFAIAEKQTNYIEEKEISKKGIIIKEKRLARGPLFAITPFSSPLSSPAHKIALGIMAGTSILFKPSHLAKQTGKALFKIISKATKGKYVYFYEENSQKDLQKIISDDRIGIISFTGGYEVGKKIIRVGGVKKYHMELSGGNSPIIFAEDYYNYNDELIEKIIDGILAKNGQRCVSIKHIFIPLKQKEFVNKIKDRLLSIKFKIKENFSNAKKNILGPLITKEYAMDSETKVNLILQQAKNYTMMIKFERQKDYVFPTMYIIQNCDKDVIKQILEFDLPGPIVFVYLYKDKTEFEQILAALKNDYVQSGLQLSFFTKNNLLVNSLLKNLVWGGIIVNNIPTFRDEFMSFGGFGKAGLGKEGFFETLNLYTDPQVRVHTL
ncbi:MAG: aldehyde dehydrogenase family protein [bacterium]|nr:aldehyde dehydrogenase family protein [bacterium]